MVDEIVKVGARQVDEIRGINRDLVEKALRMHCLAYLSQIKAQLLTRTIIEIDKSKKNLLLVNSETIRQREQIATQKDLLELRNEELQEIKTELEQRVVERTHDLQQTNRELKTEIDERKRAETALRESEARFRGLLESAPDAMVIVNRNGMIDIVNEQTENFFGYTRDELIGRSIELLIPEKMREQHVNQRTIYFKEPGTHVRAMGAASELYARHKDGQTIPVEIRLSPLKTDKELLVSSTIRDISERKRTEAELIKHRAHLEDLVAERTTELESKNKDLESFSYMVAHDLRAPLRTVTSFSQLVLEDAGKKLDSKEIDSLHRVITAAKHMARLIEDILTLSQISREDIDRSSINLSKQADAVLARLRDLEPERHIQVTIQPELWVEGAPRLLMLLLENLLQNAWKYTRPRSEASIELGADTQVSETVYYVRDNGVGFDMHYVDRLFSPFVRLHSDEQFEGKGVGLAIVQRILKRHGGRIWCESAVDKGATFFFTLPADTEPQPV